MNKHEIIDKLKRHLTVMSEVEGSEYDKGYKYATKQHLAMIAELDEPKKPVVPQFVADWYEENKDYFEWNLYNLCVDFDQRELPDGLHGWFTKNNNKPIETLVMMHKFGYEVEKEKLYTVEIPNPNGGEYGRVFLGKYSCGKVGLHCWTSYKQINFDDSWKKDKIAQLTESEIKKDFAWAWKFAEEVEE